MPVLRKITGSVALSWSLIALFCALTVSSSSFAQEPRPVKLEWESDFYIPWPLPKQSMPGATGAARMRKLCEDKSDDSQSMVEDIIREYRWAAEDFCSQFDRTYLETDIFGQLCQITEINYPLMPPGFDDPSTPDDEEKPIDCEALENFISWHIAQASMSGNKVVLEFKPGHVPCITTTASVCAPNMQALANRVKDLDE
jgi:hypothetical protein